MITSTSNGNRTSFGEHVWNKLQTVQSQAFIGESIDGLPIKKIKSILRFSKRKHLECVKAIDKILNP